MVSINWVCEDYDNFGELLESDYHAASGLLYRLGIELGDDGKPSVELPWMNHELIVYPTEYDFGLYQLDDGLYKVFNFADNDYGFLLHQQNGHMAKTKPLGVISQWLFLIRHNKLLEPSQ